MKNHGIHLWKIGIIMVCIMFISTTVVFPNGKSEYSNFSISKGVRYPEGWSEDVRLSYTANCSERPVIATNGGAIHVVWRGTIKTPTYYDAIFYRKSSDCGKTWGEEKKITDVESIIGKIDMAVEGNNIHVVWADLRSGKYEIYYKNSTDNGATWSEEKALTDDDGLRSNNPCVCVCSNMVYVTWEDERDWPEKHTLEIYYKKSIDNGNTWSDDIRLTYALSWEYTSVNPKMRVNVSNIHVIFERYIYYEPENWWCWESYYIKSEDNGENWTEPMCITPWDGKNSEITGIAVNGSNVHVVWLEWKDGNKEIYYRSSTDNGDTWNPIIRLTNTSYNEGGLTIVVEGNNVHVIWQYDLYGNYMWNVYYMNSTNNGESWGSALRLTYASNSSGAGKICVCNDYIHLIYVNNRTGKYDYNVYYKRSPDFASNISLTANPSSLPADGSSTSIITATVTNKTGSPIEGLNVSFSIESGSGTLLSSYNYTDSGGTTSVTYRTGTISGDVVIDASVDGVWNTTTITLTSEGPADISLTASLSVLTADDISTSLITATVTNETGNPVEGVDVDFTIELGCGSLSVNSDITDANGNATTTYTAGTTIGDVVIKATANGLSNTTTITLHAGPVAWIYIEPSGPIELNITESQTFTATGYDIFDNINNSWTPEWSTDHAFGTVTPNVFTCSYTAGNTSGTDYINVTDTVTGVYNVSQINIIIKDDKPPVVTDKTPTGTNVSVNTNITVTFNESMNQTSVENAFSITPTVTGNIDWDGNTMIFTPISNLSYEAVYNVTVTTDAKDAAGNHLENNYSWEFTTEKEKVNHAPEIEYYQPLSNPTINETENITFNITATDIDTGDTITIQWYLNGTLMATGDSYSFASDYDSADTYIVNVTVSDGKYKVSHEWILTVNNVNRAPTAIISSPSNNAKFTTKDNILFDAAGSSDPDNDNLIYTWNSDVDGDIGNTASFSKKLSKGTHTITLTVDDGNDGVDTKQITIVVNKPSEPSGGFIPGFETTLLAFVCLLAVIIILLRKHKT